MTSISILFFGTFSSLADEKLVTADDSVSLKELEVTASRNGYNSNNNSMSLSKINRDDIDKQSGYNVLNFIGQFTPGLFVTERNIAGFGVGSGGSGAITIRGIGGAPNNQVLVVIDGQPQYQGIFGHPLADTYQSSDVQSIEVVRGPASVLYGSNAMAGVINIITRKSKKEKEINLRATYGSFNTRNLSGNISFNKNKFSSYISANHAYTDGHRTNTDFLTNNGYAKVGYAIHPHWNISADVSQAFYRANDNGPVHLPAPYHIDISRGRTSLSINNQHHNNEGVIRIYHNYGKHKLSDGWISNDYNSGVMAYQHWKLNEKWHLTGGLDLIQLSGLGNKGLNANKFLRMQSGATYVQTQFILLEQLTINGGLRYETNSIYGNEWVYHGGVNWLLGELTGFRANVSKGYRNPTLMELYLYAPNPALRPENMMNYEASWRQKWFNNKWTTDLTVYNSLGSNLIQVVGIPPAVKRQNTGSFRNQGVELSTKYQINRYFHTNLNYGFLQTSQNMLAAPKHNLHLMLGFAAGRHQSHLGLQHVNGLVTSLMPLKKSGYTLINFHSLFKITERLTTELSANNLLNQTYEINYGYPMPGIHFSGGLKYHL